LAHEVKVKTGSVWVNCSFNGVGKKDEDNNKMWMILSPTEPFRGSVYIVQFAA